MIPKRHRVGFSLVELLTVMVALTILVGILTLLLKLTLDTERAQAGAFDRLLQTSRLADQFRADVAKAEKTLANWHDLLADERTLILSLKDKAGIVYQWKDGSLLRSVYAADDITERVVPIAAKDVRFELVHPVGENKLIRVRLHRLRDGQDLTGQAIEIAAAIGGSQR